MLSSLCPPYVSTLSGNHVGIHGEGRVLQVNKGDKFPKKKTTERDGIFSRKIQRHVLEEGGCVFFIKRGMPH